MEQINENIRKEIKQTIQEIANQVGSDMQDALVKAQNLNTSLSQKLNVHQNKFQLLFCQDFLSNRIVRGCCSSGFDNTKIVDSWGVFIDYFYNQGYKDLVKFALTQIWVGAPFSRLNKFDFKIPLDQSRQTFMEHYGYFLLIAKLCTINKPEFGMKHAWNYLSLMINMPIAEFPPESSISLQAFIKGIKDKLKEVYGTQGQKLIQIIKEQLVPQLEIKFTNTPCKIYVDQLRVYLKSDEMLSFFK